MERNNLTCAHGEFHIKKSARCFISLAIVTLLLILLRPFIAYQIFLKGDGYLNYGMFGDAIREYKKAVFLNPYLNEAWNWLGYTYRELDDKENAIKTYEKAVEINPYNRVAYYNLGMIYASTEDHKSAKVYFLKAVSIPPEYIKKDEEISGVDYCISSLEVLSICQERLGEIEEAIGTNKKILELYPSRESARAKIEKLKRLRKRSF